jgi:hypothetical protein
LQCQNQKQGSEIWPAIQIKFTKITKICFVVGFDVKETLAETEFRRGSEKVGYDPKVAMSPKAALEKAGRVSSVRTEWAFTYMAHFSQTNPPVGKIIS